MNSRGLRHKDENQMSWEHAAAEEFTNTVDVDAITREPVTVRARAEALLLRMVILILRGRNVARSPVVSRRDNNEMYGMAERLEQIEYRIRTGYGEVEYESQ